MKKTILIIMILTIFTKMLGFSRDLLLSYFYGVSNISDAYLISITIPTLIVAFIGTGVTTSFIPMYNKIQHEKGVLEADIFTNTVIKFFMIICTVLIITVLIFTGPIVKIFASGFEDEIFKLTVIFTKISVISIYFAALIYIFGGYLQLKDNFHVPAMMGIPNNLIIMLSIFLSIKFGLYILAIGTVIAMFFQMIFLLYFINKTGLRFNLKKEKDYQNIKKMVFLSIPVIFGVSVNQINVLVDRTMASNIAVGGISVLNYADRINEFIQAIFVMSIITVMYPKISKLVIDGNIVELKNNLTNTISGISILVIPATVCIMLLAKPIITLLFGRGAFNHEAIIMTSNVLFFYSFGLIWFGIREAISRTFFALLDTKTPMINAAIGLILNIILNIILSKYMGLSGLALATSLSAMVSTGILFFQLEKKIGSDGRKKILVTVFKIIFASLIMGSVIMFVNIYIVSYMNNTLALFVTIIFGLVAYLIIIYYMKIEVVQILVDKIKKMIKIRGYKKIA